MKNTESTKEFADIFKQLPKDSSPLTEDEINFVYRDSKYEVNSKRWNKTYRKAYNKKGK